MGFYPTTRVKQYTCKYSAATSSFQHHIDLMAHLLSLSMWTWTWHRVIKKQWSVFQNRRPAFPISFPPNSPGISVVVVFKARTVTVSKNALKSEEENTIPNTWATGGARREECERRGIEQGRAICKVFICMHCTVEQSAKCGSNLKVWKCGSNLQMHSFAIPRTAIPPAVNEMLVFRLRTLFWHVVTAKHETTEWPQGVTERCQSPDHGQSGCFWRRWRLAGIF